MAVIIEIGAILIAVVAAAMVWRRYAFTRIPLTLVILHHLAMLAAVSRAMGVLCMCVLVAVLILVWKSR
jgi:hypothetical protein